MSLDNSPGGHIPKSRNETPESANRTIYQPR